MSAIAHPQRPGHAGAASAVPTDFSSDDAARASMSARINCSIISHAGTALDAQVRAQITELYARFLAPGMLVLDLMSSWVSHLPDQLELDVTGSV